jgi:hypothetical protein
MNFGSIYGHLFCVSGVLSPPASLRLNRVIRLEHHRRVLSPCSTCSEVQLSLKEHRIIIVNFSLTKIALSLLMASATTFRNKAETCRSLMRYVRNEETLRGLGTMIAENLAKALQ